MKRLRVVIAQGSISACAEAPPACAGSRRSPAVYLRVCGGTPEGRHSSSIAGGLSPRVRRHPGLFFKGLCQRGSISACAEAPSHLVSQTIL